MTRGKKGETKKEIREEQEFVKDVEEKRKKKRDMKKKE